MCRQGPRGMERPRGRGFPWRHAASGGLPCRERRGLMIVCLSPNGRTEHAGAHPPTRLLVGTVYGVALLERAAPGARWEVAGHSLAGRHVSALLYEPERGGVFAS